MDIWKLMACPQVYNCFQRWELWLLMEISVWIKRASTVLCFSTGTARGRVLCQASGLKWESRLARWCVCMGGDDFTHVWYTSAFLLTTVSTSLASLSMCQGKKALPRFSRSWFAVPLWVFLPRPQRLLVWTAAVILGHTQWMLPSGEGFC